MSYIEFKHVVKEYITGETKIRALNDANFSVKKGELAVILGSSGAGKTTALNILGGMDTPTSGAVWVDGKVHPRILLAPTQVMRGMTLVGCGKGGRFSDFAAGAEVLPAYCEQAKILGGTFAFARSKMARSAV